MQTKKIYIQDRKKNPTPTMKTKRIEKRGPSPGMKTKRIEKRGPTPIMKTKMIYIQDKKKRPYYYYDDKKELYFCLVEKKGPTVRNGQKTDGNQTRGSVLFTILGQTDF